MTNNVKIRRVLRDGTESISEGMPDFIARLVVTGIPYSEPNTARAIIVHDVPVQPIRFAHRQDAYGLALAMAGQLPGGLILH